MFVVLGLGKGGSEGKEAAKGIGNVNGRWKVIEGKERGG